MNCLHIAAWRGHFKLCKLLIEKHNFDVHVNDNKGRPSLHFSAQSGSYELVKFFIEKGANIYLKTENGMNCLHFEVLRGHLNLCKMLVNKHNFDVHMTADSGRLPLQFCVQSGSYELLMYFAGKGTNFSNIKDSELVSCDEVLRYSVHMTDHEGFNCLHIVALNGHLNLCRLLINKHKLDVHVANSQVWTAVHCSVQNDSKDLVNLFADMITDVHLKTNDGSNCRHIAALHGHLNLCKALVNKHNFDVDITENDGWSSLHFSVLNGSYELVNFFTDMGANIHLKTNDGKNCLHIAALNGHLNLCKMFLDNHKFDVHVSDYNEWRPFHFSAKNGNFELFSYLLDKGSEIYCQTKNMENILYLSAGNGHLKICKFVLQHFAKDYHDSNSKNQHVLYGNIYKSQVFYKYNTIFLHAMDIDGNACLHLAADGNHSKICEMLLKYDTDIITLLNKNDETARDVAMENSHENVLNALKVKYDRPGMFIYCLSIPTFFIEIQKIQSQNKIYNCLLLKSSCAYEKNHSQSKLKKTK